jgi:hypothetical protein
MPLDENHNVINQNGQTALRAAEGLAHQAPPLYEDHQFDQLYSELDPNGYMTPRNESGPATPFGSHSRNISAENVTSMNQLTDPNLSATVLHSRLSNLHLRHQNPETDAERPELAVNTEVSSRPRSGLGAELLNARRDPVITSPTISRRTSEEDHVSSGAITPYPQFDEVEDLSRVPSYTTAVRSAARTSLNNDLPDYNAATAGDLAVQSPPRTPRRVQARGARRPVSFTGTPQWLQLPQQRA